MRHPMNTGLGTTPKPSEGESNMSPRRARWAERTHGPEVRAALEADAGQFLHQSVSTPCLSVAARAYGPYVEDTEGRRYLDFHGNNVHHVGYGHPRVKAAIVRQMDELPFSPRRFACEHDAVVPDLLVMGKGLGGEILPIAAVLARRELDVMGAFAIGHYTHEKNPVTAAAGLATIAIIEEEGLVEHAAELGARASAGSRTSSTATR